MTGINKQLQDSYQKARHAADAASQGLTGDDALAAQIDAALTYARKDLPASLRALEHALGQPLNPPLDPASVLIGMMLTANLLVGTALTNVLAHHPRIRALYRRHLDAARAEEATRMITDPLPYNIRRCKTCGCLDAIPCVHATRTQPQPPAALIHAHVAPRPLTCSWHTTDQCSACHEEPHPDGTDTGWTHPNRQATDTVTQAIRDHHRTLEQRLTDPAYARGWDIADATRATNLTPWLDDPDDDPHA